jgi:hypothetical protein
MKTNHKTDLGTFTIDIRGLAELRRTTRALVAAAKRLQRARIALQKQATK